MSVGPIIKKGINQIKRQGISPQLTAKTLLKVLAGTASWLALTLVGCDDVNIQPPPNEDAGICLFGCSDADMPVVDGGVPADAEVAETVDAEGPPPEIPNLGPANNFLNQQLVGNRYGVELQTAEQLFSVDENSPTLAAYPDAARLILTMGTQNERLFAEIPDVLAELFGEDANLIQGFVPMGVKRYSTHADTAGLPILRNETSGGYAVPSQLISPTTGNDILYVRGGDLAGSYVEEAIDIIDGRPTQRYFQTDEAGVRLRSGGADIDVTEIIVADAATYEHPLYGTEIPMLTPAFGSELQAVTAEGALTGETVPATDSFVFELNPGFSTEQAIRTFMAAASTEFPDLMVTVVAIDNVDGAEYAVVENQPLRDLDGTAIIQQAIDPAVHSYPSNPGVYDITLRVNTSVRVPMSSDFVFAAALDGTLQVQRPE